MARSPLAVDMPRALPSATIEARVRATPTTAVISGSPAAASEPKVISRTTAATPMPRNSPIPAGGSPATAPPPASTVRPEVRARSTAAVRSARPASVTLSSVTS